ncbi:chaperone NapD [Thalassotalea atypica]|uniref:chaperone NapD n=1 Tax=Thalassotalea atypica TaxID=2054316 RepID=UPI0025741C4C|nr:chaperone NapD [Thalassotalea atypica]
MTQEHEYHVASFVAHGRPESSEVLSQEIIAIEGAEIHAVSEEGKIVFTIEANNQKLIAARLDEFKHHDELMSLSPIYHQFLTENEPN